MKFLFVTESSGPDYMSDMVFHGGKSLYGINFYESNRVWYMYDDVTNKKDLYGRGFTLYGKISSQLYSPIKDNLINLIKDKYFNYIIYGSIWRCADYFDIVSKIYKKDEIIAIDGEDEQDRINFYFVDKCKYFKREYNKKIDGVFPINFCIPKQLILKNLKNKEKLISDIIPNFNQNYFFEQEIDYYDEYARSAYAHTSKKGGWDCLRHYEIMMNGCVPIFHNLENCPNNTLTKIPKKQIIEFSKIMNFNTEKNEFILDYVKNNLTTEHIFLDLLT